MSAGMKKGAGELEKGKRGREGEGDVKKETSSGLCMVPLPKVIVNCMNCKQVLIK